jgi:hypothetical protein
MKKVEISKSVLSGFVRCIKLNSVGEPRENGFSEYAEDEMVYHYEGVEMIEDEGLYTFILCEEDGKKYLVWDSDKEEATANDFRGMYDWICEWMEENDQDGFMVGMGDKVELKNGFVGKVVQVHTMGHGDIRPPYHLKGGFCLKGTQGHLGYCTVLPEGMEVMYGGEVKFDQIKL